MRNFLLVLSTTVALAGSALGQTPTIFDVSDVVVGAQKLDTLWFYAQGKWSDADGKAAANSTEIHCYKRFSFCEIANAMFLFEQASVSLDSFDILRWDSRELLAVDSSPICAVNNLRVDFVKKQVSISSTSKNVVTDPLCKAADKTGMPTAFLLGAEDVIKQEIEKKPKQ
jgi:hypothetical protein